MARSFKILDPEEAINLITNPSFETDATGWTTVGGATDARSTDQQRRGVYSLALTPSSSTQGGVYYGPTSLTSGQSYTAAADILGYGSVNYEIGFFTTAGVALGTATDITGADRWDRKSATYASTGTMNALIYIRKDNDASTRVFYIDGAQLVNLDHDTSYVDGDQEGFLEDGYYWQGTPHASKSVRSSQERSGGQEKDLETLKFKVSNPVGSGMPAVVHHTQGLALLPGAEYVGYKVMPRIMELTGVIEGTNDDGLLEARKDVIDLIKPDLVKGAQPFILREYLPNGRGPVQFKMVYDSGAEWNAGAPTEQVNMRLIGYDPFAKEDGQEGAALTGEGDITNADYVVNRHNGTWRNITTNIDSNVFGAVKGLNGLHYIFGNFSWNEPPQYSYMISYDTFNDTYANFGSSPNGNILAAAVSSNGDIYVGGEFTDLGDVSGDRIAYLDVSADDFASLAADIDNGLVSTLAFGLDGILYVGGTFTNVVDASGDYCTQWSGSAFSSMGTGASAAVNAIATHPDGNIYFGGDGVFGGGSSTGLGIWSGSAWSDVGSGVSGGGSTVEDIVIDKNGLVYICGNFTSIDGVSCNYIGVWNGETAEPLGSGLNAVAHSMALTDSGELIVSGQFTTAGGITLPERVAKWNGTSWAPLGVTVPGTPTIYVAAIDNDVYLGYSTAGTATTEFINTVTNNGTALTYPVVTLKRTGGTSATAVSLKNETTGAEIPMFYSLLDGETLTLDFRPGQRSVTSSMFGSSWNAVLRGADFTGFYLQPGSNSIALFVSNNGATLANNIWWDVQHWSADGVAA